MNVDDLLSLGRLSEIALADEHLFASVSRLSDDGASYVSDLWRLPLDGGRGECWTPGPWSDRAPRVGSDGTLRYLSNRCRGKSPADGEDQRAQVWQSTAGEPVRVTDLPLGVVDFRVDGDTLYLWTPLFAGVPFGEQRAHAEERRSKGPSILRYRETPTRYWDHWLAPTSLHLFRLDANGDLTDLTPDSDREYRRELHWDVRAGVVVTCPDERAEDGGVRSWVRVLEDGRPPLDLGRSGCVYHWSPSLSPSGRRLAAHRSPRTTHLGDDRLPEGHLVLFDLDGHEADPRARESVVPGDGTGTARHLLAEVDRWFFPRAWRDERRLLCTYDEDGCVKLAEVDVEADTFAPLRERGSVHAVQADVDRVATIESDLLGPPRAELDHTPLFDVAGQTDTSVLVDTIIAHGADGAEVHGYVLRPGDEDGPFPTILWIHGGPIHHWADGWHWRWNPLAFVDAGYCVAMPNPRGSTGYGYDFTAGIWGNTWGAACYEDLMRFTDALALREEVDGERIAAMGGSFGGYMTNYIGGKTDRFRALVTHASLYDLRAFWGSTDAAGYFSLHLASTPWSGELDRHSPHKGVPQWKTPTLILHGEKDYRVPIGEALALFEGLQRHGVESELVVFPDENHWIAKPRNVRAWHDAIFDFLDRTLAADG